MFPININLHNKQCLVIGGGQVAGRKISNLLLYGAIITVVSPGAEKKCITGFARDDYLSHKGILSKKIAGQISGFNRHR